MKKSAKKGNKTAKKPEKSHTDGRQPAVDAHPWLASYPQGIAWDSVLAGRELPALLDDAVSRHGDRPCTRFLGRRMTYAEIGALADRAAKGLQSLGVGRGARVGLLLPNTPSYVVFYFAILKTGATVVNFNPLYTVAELDHQVRDSGTTVMVTLDLADMFSRVEALLERGVLERAVICPFSALLPPLKGLLFRLFKPGETADTAGSPAAAALVDEAALLDNDGAFTPAGIDPEEDIAVLQYTGGTTGTPKGAMLTHANLTINVEQVRLWARNVEEGEERIMGILPFFHVFAMTTVLNFGVLLGAEMILTPKFELADALKLIHRTRPTYLPGVPTLFNAMIHYPRIAGYELSSIKLCISGGAALPIEVKRGFEEISGCTLIEGYGLSETSPVATCNPVDGPVREGSIGLPLPGTVLSIRSLDDPEKAVEGGESGEICIAGPQVMKGYWNRPEETREAFSGEFFRSGDIGYMAEDGFTYIVDRLKDMIIVSGYNVYPRRIEEAIYAFPAVEEVTVVGVPDDYRGEAPKAFVKLREGETATAEDIFAFLETRISKLEMPSEIAFREELPKTMVGKLSRKELREEAKAGTAAG